MEVTAFPKTSTPEEAGLSERQLARFLARIKRYGINLHSIVMARGDSIFFEHYTAPFTETTPHRMYSTTKSFVALAIGCLIDEGKLSLDDRIVSFFPEDCPEAIDPLLSMQTIRDTLTMRTCITGAPAALYSKEAMGNRIHAYMNAKGTKYPGTLFEYDSAGSHVLTALAEKLAGCDVLTYLKARLLDKIGGFENADMLKTADGVSWGSSALLCTPRALLSVIRFLLNGGVWNGETLLSPDFVRSATSCQTVNNFDGAVRYDRMGYGYQIWQNYGGSFSFNGMAGQFALGVPDKDFMFVCTGDTQMTAAFDQPRLFDALFEEIVSHLDGAHEEPVALEAPAALSVAGGLTESPLMPKIDGMTFRCHDNTMGIRRFCLSFTDGTFTYENAQGEKVLPFGLGENVSALFPQYGYPNDIGFVHDETSPFRYRCVTSGAWCSPTVFQLYCQVIDRYFGVLRITFGFLGNDRVTVRFLKNAQDFFDEYSGWLIAEKE